MATRRSRSRAALATQIADLTLAVPQVVAHRVSRIASAGMNPSPQDRDEFYRMSAEKVEAFCESWMAMQLESYRLSQEWMLSGLQSMWMPWLPGTKRSGRRQVQRAAGSLVAHGLAPYSRRASANARRLARRRRLK